MASRENITVEGKVEAWGYRETYLYFADGKLIRIVREK